jgi:flagellar hook assembly protein FlgD
MTLVARITYLILVAATFAAFFVAQRLKSEPPVIDVNNLARHFSPNGDGLRDGNDFSVVLKVADDVTVDVVTLDGDRVKRLADGVRVAAKRPLELDWDGTTDEGRRAPDGQYRLRVTLRDEGRAAIVQQTMNVDTRAPRSEVCVGFRCNDPQKRMGNIISQGDRLVKIYIKGVSSLYATQFRVLRTDQGAPREVARLRLKAGAHRLDWDPRVNGEPLDPGTYLVQAEVRDRAGNVGITPAVLEAGADIPGRPGLTVRGLNAQPPLRPVTAGNRVEFRVDARGAPYRWRVRRVGDTRVRDRGSETDSLLALRAPRGPSGAYLLELRSGRWHTTVPFLVQATERSRVLVVVPALAWLGTDKVDDPPFDGLPNTLLDGGTVRWPRVFNGKDGLPAGFAEDVAPLLVFLDRRRIRYDLTSDLDLELTRNPRASDREGVLMLGSPRWVTRSLGRRLRRYVDDGGRLAVIGADSLRRGVRLRVHQSEESGTLSRATQPAAADPFGTRVARVRTTSQPVSISQFEGGPGYGLMEGVLDLRGFTRLEEATSIGDGDFLAAVGQPLSAEEEAAAASSDKPAREVRAALSAVRLGKGTVIRVGLPEWPRRLDAPEVAQVTRNIVDILRGVQPRIRSSR